MPSDYEHSDRLCNILADQSQWPKLSLNDDFARLNRRIQSEVSSESISSQIASVFVMHQIMNEMTRHLISLSILYVQGEIWPTEYKPAYDRGDDRESGWYLTYLSDSCINFKSKDQFISRARDLNKMRNKLAHNMTSKNEDIITDTFNKYLVLHKKMARDYRIAEKDVLYNLYDLTKRVDFGELAGDESTNRNL